MVTKFEQSLILEFLQYLQCYEVAMAWVVLQALLKCSEYLHCLEAYFFQTVRPLIFTVSFPH